MKREPIWRRYLRFWGPSPSADIDDEFEFHIEAKVDDLVAAGYSRDEARQEAIRQFGKLRPLHRECLEIRKQQDKTASRAEYFAGWSRDLRYAIRALSRSKLAALGAVFILALGIGGTTAVFTLLDRLIFKPLPVPQPGELVLVRPTQDGDETAFRYEEYAFLRDNNSTLAGISGSGMFRMRESHGRDQIVDPAEANPVTGNYFDTLRVAADIGRTLTPEDDFPNASHVAVASHRFAVSRFGQPAEALGKTVFLKDVPFTIIGILPPWFSGISKGSRRGDLYVPLSTMAEAYGVDMFRRSPSIILFARVKSGVRPAAAQANLQELMQRFFGRQPGQVSQSYRVVLDDGSAGYPGIQGERKQSLQLLGTIIAILLLMACLSVGCLLLARGAARQHEISIRLCLGAGKARVLRQILMESCLLAAVGGLAGLVVATVAERLILAGLRYEDAPVDLSMDARVLACGLAASLLTGVLCGISPAVQLLRSGRLVPNSERVVGAFASGRALVVVEIALSVVMIAGAATFLRGFWVLRSAPLGFDHRNMPVVHLQLTKDVQPQPGDSEKVLLQAAVRVGDRLRLDTRIAAVAVGNTLPFGEGFIGMPVRRPDLQASPRDCILLRVDSHYFNAMGIQLAAGRMFSDMDDQSAPNVVMISATLAKGLFPNENPVGKELQALRQRVTVIGVVNDIKFDSLKTPAPEILYSPIAQTSRTGAQSGSAKIHLRTRLRPSDAEALVRQAIVAERVPLRVVDTFMLDEEVGYSYFNDTVRMKATAGLGAIGLMLIAAGIYGLMAFWVTQRTREIGVRMAIGSTSARIMSLVLKQSLRLAAFGLLIGVPAALLLTRYLAAMIFGAPPIDYAAVGAAAAILVTTALCAAAIPARRAAKLDPLEALRVE